MGNEDSNYRRKEDQEWRDSVQTRLASLTDSELTQNDRFDEIDEELHTIKEMLEGKASDRKDNGIKGDIHDLALSYNTLRAIMAPDSLGHGGFINRMRRVEEQLGIEAVRDEKEERKKDRRWTGLVPIIIAIVSFVGLILTSLDRIEPYVKKMFRQPPAEFVKTKKRPRKVTVQYRVVPAPKEVQEASDDRAAP